MGCRCHALAGLLLQLCGPSGNLLRLPAAQTGPALERHAARPTRLVVPLDLNHDPDGALEEALASGLLARGRRAGRGVLLPGFDVADQRLSRPAHALAGDVAASVERLCRHDWRRRDCRVYGRALRLGL